jgi:phage-related protein
VTNSGNTKSKPRITIYGNGTINLSLNGSQIFVIALGNEGQITIDSAQMEAYNGGILKNRLVTGDYDNFVLNVGENTLSWTGNVSEIEIDNYSRWI